MSASSLAASKVPEDCRIGRVVSLFKEAARISLVTTGCQTMYQW